MIDWADVKFGGTAYFEKVCYKMRKCGNHTLRISFHQCWGRNYMSLINEIIFLLYSIESSVRYIQEPPSSVMMLALDALPEELTLLYICSYICSMNDQQQLCVRWFSINLVEIMNLTLGKCDVLIFNQYNGCNWIIMSPSDRN